MKTKSHYGTAFVLKDYDQYCDFCERYCGTQEIDGDEFDHLIRDGIGILPNGYSESDETDNSIRIPVSNYDMDDDGLIDPISFIPYSASVPGGLGEREYLESATIIFADHSLAIPGLPDAYASIDDLIAEFKSKIASYFDDDFDYENHIGFVRYFAYTA